jgi:transposase
MAAQRLPMRKLREVLRLRLDRGASVREIAVACNLARSTVCDYVGRVQVAKLTWPLPPELDDAALEKLLFPDEHHPVAQRPEPDWPAVHRELRRPHVTRMLLWQEYREREPAGYQYSQFCERYGQWANTLPITMRQTHRAGEKLFVDFSGDGLPIVDRRTGTVQIAKLFVAVLGASNFTYVEPVLREDLPTWIGCHVRAFDFMGGVTMALVPDNLKAGVTRPSFYDPEINPTYADLARHYGVTVLPARPRKPRDKAKAEQGVLLAERWILAALRHRTFYSLDELTEAIGPLLDRLNDRPMRKLKVSRRALFETLDRPALRPLPPTAYELATFKYARANIDYHVEFEDHYYSIPYQLRRKVFDLRATATTIEVLLNGRRVASHARSYVPHTHTTTREHMPSAHRAYAEWTPSRLIAWASTVGPNTAALVTALIEQRAHPEHGYRACLGVLRLRKRFPDHRLERACARALAHRAVSYRSVEAILKHNLDREEDAPDVPAPDPLPRHANLRGPGYYH